MASDGAAGSIFLLFVRSPPHRLLGRDPPLETLTKENLHWAELHVARDGQTDGGELACVVGCLPGIRIASIKIYKKDDHSRN
jgi:hypothetical protein